MTFVTTPRIARIACGLLVAFGAAAASMAQTPAQAPAQAQTKPAVAPPAYAVCAACHESTPNARPSLGPNLFGVGGRKAGSFPDYDYSPAMKDSMTIWTAETLAAFILDPAKALPGNKMDYDGAADADTAKAIADYLLTLKP